MHIVALLRSHFESALAEQRITREEIGALPQETQTAVLSMMDAYGKGDQEDGFFIIEAEKDRLAQDREGMTMQEYLIASLQLDNIHAVCRALWMKQRILSPSSVISPN